MNLIEAWGNYYFKTTDESRYFKITFDNQRGKQLVTKLQILK